VAVPEEVIQEVEQELIPPNLPVFQLVPPEFDQCLRYLYHHLPEGLKPFHRDNVWPAYRQLLQWIEAWGPMHHGNVEAFHNAELTQLEEVELPQGQPLQEQAVPPGMDQYAYLGGVNYGLGPEQDLTEELNTGLVSDSDDEGEDEEIGEFGMEVFTGYEDGWL
jgi:hypothetical protein